MFLQGDLQAVFDALYAIGAIDPVLKMDWEQVTQEMLHNPQQVYRAFDEINACAGNRDMIAQKLGAMDQRSINYVAMEVAREFCEFQDKHILH